MAWLELSVEVDAEAAEPVSELLAQYGYNGGVVVDQPIIPGPDGPDYAYDTSRPVRLRTYLMLDERAEERRAQIEQGLWHLGRLRYVGALQVQQIEEQDWANAWKQHYTIQRIGERTVIVPSWLDYAAEPGELIVRLDPGMAFGTGLHPTTQLCLMFIERLVQPGVRALDLGCGSGILAIAAARQGASVLALDTDPIAVDATRQNLELNGLADLVRVEQGSLGQGAQLGHWLGWDDASQPAGVVAEGTFDVIVANIVARVLVALAPDLASALVAGGLLVSSGIFIERENEVALAYAAAGLTLVERQQAGEWVAFVHQAP